MCTTTLDPDGALLARKVSFPHQFLSPSLRSPSLLSLPSPLEGELLVPYPPLVPSPSAELDSLPQRRHPMPLAIIDGVLRDETGLPTAQLVAVVSETHEGESYGVGQKVKGADGTRGVWLGHLELQLPVGEARDGRGGWRC